MNDDTSKPFESLESAHEYVGLLREVLDEAYVAILDDTAAAQELGATRRIDALRLALSSADFCAASGRKPNCAS